MIALKNILVPTDFGEAADAALSYARALARAFGGTLHVLHVTDNISARAVAGEAYSSKLFTDLQHDIEEAAHQRLDECLIDNDPNPVPTKPVIVMSTTPAVEIVRYAQQANVDLIVMGTHGRGAVARLLIGSVAERVVRIAPCPVLTVHHPEHEFVLPDTLAAVAHA